MFRSTCALLCGLLAAAGPLTSQGIALRRGPQDPQPAPRRQPAQEPRAPGADLQQEMARLRAEVRSLEAAVRELTRTLERAAASQRGPDQRPGRDQEPGRVRTWTFEAPHFWSWSGRPLVLHGVPAEPQRARDLGPLRQRLLYVLPERVDQLRQVRTRILERHREREEPQRDSATSPKGGEPQRRIRV